MSTPWGTGTWGTGEWGGLAITEPQSAQGVALSPEDVPGGFSIDTLGNAAPPPIDLNAIVFDIKGRVGLG